jgi:hypothetical protein
MALEELANMAEVLGMLVVAVTFIFLTIQMRQSARSQRSTTTHNASNMALAIYDPIAKDADFAELLLRGLRDPASLSSVEAARFTAHWQYSFFTWQNWFYQRGEGELDEEIWEGFTQLLADVFHTPGLQFFWQQRRQYFAGSFRNYLETELLSKEQSPGYKILGSVETGGETEQGVGQA